MAATWTSATVNTPAANEVIVDCGAVPGYGNYVTKVWLNCTVAGTFLLQHRNAANDATLHQQEISIAANSIVDLETANITLNASERIRVVSKATLLVGDVSGSVFSEAA